MSWTIAIHAGHNATVVFRENWRNNDGTYCDGNHYRAIELERLYKQRYFYLHLKTPQEFEQIMKDVLAVAKKEWEVEDTFDKVFFYGKKEHREVVERMLGPVQPEPQHHECHARGAFALCNFQEAFVVSYDGGGNDGLFNIYLAKDKEPIKVLSKFNINLGTAYGVFGYPISEVKGCKDPGSPSFLGFAGKLMGLAAYGKVQESWVPHIMRFYEEYVHDDFDSHLKNLKKLSGWIGVDLSNDALSGQISYDLAATSQHVFEEVFFKYAWPILSLNDLPICLTGGAALNVTLNERIRQTGKKVFVPPQPDDGGLAFGMLCPVEQYFDIDITYSGLPILDWEGFDKKVEERKARKICVMELAEVLAAGKIVGVVQGDSEYGPRALGNRSILCDPSMKNAKDLLNSKVKFREWYRPFAPVVRRHECNKYFEFNESSPFMSFAPKVRKEFEEDLASAVHVDGTARVQTVTMEQNYFLSTLLSCFNEVKGIGVLLNTSFNIKGKPILTTIEDALYVLDNTKLDAVYIGTETTSGYLFERSI